MIEFDSRRYLGCRFGFSVSVPPKADPDWPASYGDPESVVNEFVFTEGSGILFEGGHLVLGYRWSDAQGQWNDAGMLNHLIVKSRDFRSFRPASPNPQTGAVSAAILNLLAWPDSPPLPSDEYPHQLIKEGILEIRQVRPLAFSDSFLDGANDQASADTLLATPQGQYARLRALTAMRRELVLATDFRLCIGGALGKSEQRLPGVVEEALLTAQAGKPLYISSAFAGVSKVLADCLLKRRIKMDPESVFFTPDPVARLMNNQSAVIPIGDEFEGPSTRAGWNALAYFKNLSLTKLADQAGLNPDQYIDLLATPNIERAMAWVTTGVSNLTQRKGKS